jgi:transcriptional regulator with GAF, ATPase, and Fis domain
MTEISGSNDPGIRWRNNMPIDDNDFFREGTLRICGSLEIEKALGSCLEFLSKALPLDRLILQRFDESQNAMRTIAIATATESKAVDYLTPLSEQARKCAHEEMREVYGVYIFGTPGSCGISREMLEFHDFTCTSLMVMPLQSGEQMVGHLVCITQGEEKLNEEHARLISLLKDPFTISLSNTLKHRSELKLYDRDFFWEATKRICGSLDIKKALWQSLLFLQNYIPAEEAALLFYDSNKGTVTLNTQADSTGGRFVNFQAVIPPEIRALLDDISKLDDFVDNRAEENPIAKPILAAMARGKSSAILVRLISENVWIGSIALWASGWDKFNEEHLRLLKQLKIPYFIALSNSRRYSELLTLKDLLADDNRYLQEELQKITGSEIIGADFGLKEVMNKVRSVAALSSPVLLQGETGVGKEIIAGAIHNASQRRDGPFIKVNCGAIPETLMDSELFGHEKGAFTGAIDQKRGRFERANGGTIFLDEIGELSLEAQVRMLRVLQEKEIERVGGTEPVKVDIRVIAATHRDLQAMIREGKFREDLYFRLNVFPIYIPTLRERSGDIPGLVQHFIQKKSRELQLTSIPTLTPDAYDRLMAHHWPGNVRELENAVERAIILNREGPLSFTELTPREEYEKAPVPESDKDDLYNLDQVTINHINRVLQITNGRVEGKDGAAMRLGINPGTLRGRMRKLGISFGKNSK